MRLMVMEKSNFLQWKPDNTFYTLGYGYETEFSLNLNKFYLGETGDI